jgi:hypothetical protein
MNFLQLKNNLQHMLADDPMGINNPLVDQSTKNVRITQPHEDVHIEYFDHYMIVDVDGLEPRHVDYYHYSEAEVASEIVNLVDKL